MHFTVLAMLAWPESVYFMDVNVQHMKNYLTFIDHHYNFELKEMDLEAMQSQKCERLIGEIASL